MAKNTMTTNSNKDAECIGLSSSSDSNTISAHQMCSESDNQQQLNSSQPSLVPKGVTIGLAIFSFILSIAGYGFRLIAGDTWQAVLKHAAVLVPIFVIGIPLLFWIGALILNKVKGMHIQRRNALSLGWLLSCVTMLWLMGAYS